jgi:hypothetical protein
MVRPYCGPEIHELYMRYNMEIHGSTAGVSDEESFTRHLVGSCLIPERGRTLSHAELAERGAHAAVQAQRSAASAWDAVISRHCEELEAAEAAASRRGFETKALTAWREVEHQVGVLSERLAAAATRCERIQRRLDALAAPPAGPAEPAAGAASATGGAMSPMMALQRMFMGEGGGAGAGAVGGWLGSGGSGGSTVSVVGESGPPVLSPAPAFWATDPEQMRAVSGAMAAATGLARSECEAAELFQLQADLEHVSARLLLLLRRATAFREESELAEAELERADAARAAEWSVQVAQLHEEEARLVAHIDRTLQLLARRPATGSVSSAILGKLSALQWLQDQCRESVLDVAETHARNALWVGGKHGWGSQGDAADTGERGRAATAGSGKEPSSASSSSASASSASFPTASSPSALPGVSQGLEQLYGHFGDPDLAFAASSTADASVSASPETAPAASPSAPAAPHRSSAVLPPPVAAETAPPSVLSEWARPPWEIGPAALEGWDLRYGYGSFFVEYRLDGALACVSVLDILPSRVASVYLFYNPDLRHMEWGKMSALREAAITDRLRRVSPALRWLDFNLYAPKCGRMGYKADYKPSLLLCPYSHRWVPFSAASPVVDADPHAFTGHLAGVVCDPDSDARLGFRQGSYRTQGAIAAATDDGAAAAADDDGGGADSRAYAVAMLDALSDMAVASMQYGQEGGDTGAAAWIGSLFASTGHTSRPAALDTLASVVSQASDGLSEWLQATREQRAVDLRRIPMPRQIGPPIAKPEKGHPTLPQPREEAWPEGSVVADVARWVSGGDGAGAAATARELILGSGGSLSSSSGAAADGEAADSDARRKRYLESVMVHVPRSAQFVERAGLNPNARATVFSRLPEMAALASDQLVARALIDPAGLLFFERLDDELEARLEEARAAAAAAAQAGAEAAEGDE